MLRALQPRLRIISGGQTGADRAALNWAVRHRVPYGGWCPKGRRAEDGRIPVRHKLRPTPSGGYLQRTEWNVCDSDGTLVVSLAPGVSAGSAKTLRLALRHRKPCLHLSKQLHGSQAGAFLRRFLRQHCIQRLNVAGPRASEEPTVGAFVRQVLDALLTQSTRRRIGEDRRRTPGPARRQKKTRGRS